MDTCVSLSSRYGNLRRHFESLGARLKVIAMERERLSWRRSALPFAFDVQADARGEYFELALADDRVSFQLLQSSPDDRHLLLLANDRQRFLCGHDERHWFVAGIGERVSTVRAAKLSLIPSEIAERAKQFSPCKIDNRDNAVFKRQGEWFFVPAREPVRPRFILRNEPLQRGGSKPHVCQELCREGGELVYLVRGRILTQAEFRKVRSGGSDFQTRVRNPKVYARGYVRHRDHATLWLDGWHRVLLSAEPGSAMNAFLD